MIYRFTPLLFAVLLSGCTSDAVKPAQKPFLAKNAVLALDTSVPQGSPDALVEKARHTAPPESYKLLLDATHLYLMSHQENAARSLINQVPAHGLSSQLDARRRVLIARLAAQYESPAYVLQALQDVSQEWLSLQDRAFVHEAKGLAYQQQGMLVEATMEWAKLDPYLLDAAQARTNRQRIWDTLASLPTVRLEWIARQEPADAFVGWARLVYAVQQSEQDTNHLLAALKDWRRHFPDHPGQAFLPANLESALALAHAPKIIAVLLPLSGPHQESGEAVRAGFLAANGLTRSSANVQWYDTAGKSISAVYQQAVEAGADFVVGPLTRPEVSVLSHVPLKVPTLALNRVEHGDHKKNLFQFPLLPEEEAEKIVERAFQEGYRRAGILTVQGPFGERMSDAIRKRFERLGGTIVTIKKANPKEFSESVRTFLGIDAKAMHRYREAKKNRTKIATPHARKDLEVIFLAAPGTEARQLRPMVQFYFGGSIPIYAHPVFYTGSHNPKPDSDMNGVVFADMPCVLGQFSHCAPYQTRLEQAALMSEQGDKLFALGVDAFHLVFQLQRLLLLPDLKYPGMTGNLWMGKDQVIHRDLTFARMQQGAPQLLSPLSSAP